MIGGVFAVEQFFHCRDEVIRDGAADAAVGELHHIVFGAGFIAAAFEDIAVHAEIAKFVDNERDAFAVSVLQHVADQGCFACAEETGDDCGWDFCGHVMGSFERDCAGDVFRLGELMAHTVFVCTTCAENGGDPKGAALVEDLVARLAPMGDFEVRGQECFEHL